MTCLCKKTVFDVTCILLVVIAWSSHKWTGTSSGTSVSWTWLNRTESGTRYTPSLGCYFLTIWRWKCCIRALPFDDVRYLPDASSNVSYFLFFVADVKYGLYEINKNNRANATRGPKMLQDQTEVMMDRRLQDPRPGSVLILHVGCHLMLNLTAKLISNVCCTGSSLKKNWKQTYCQLKRINCQVAKKSKKKISFMLSCFFLGMIFLQ